MGELKYKYVWSNNGIIFAKKTDNNDGKKFSVRSITDLNRITN